jgi:hypothetical protein
MIVTDVNFLVYPQEDYYYEVCAGEVLSITYKESAGQQVYLSFGSIEEMRAVAKAMLKACEVKESV